MILNNRGWLVRLARRWFPWCFRKKSTSQRRAFLALEALEARVVPSAVLHDQSQLITHPGQGFGFADVSMLESPNTILGFNANDPVGFRLADDFTIPMGEFWSLSDVTLYGYQTNSTTASTFTEAYLELWSGVPGLGGSVLVSRSPNC